MDVCVLLVVVVVMVVVVQDEVKEYSAKVQGVKMTPTEELNMERIEEGRRKARR
jgi:hypothetical protein